MWHLLSLPATPPFPRGPHVTRTDLYPALSRPSLWDWRHQPVRLPTVCSPSAPFSPPGQLLLRDPARGLRPS